MCRTTYLVRTALLAGIGLTLAACATAPASYGYYGPSGYDDYGVPPVYGTVDFAYGGGWHHGWDHGWHNGGHFAHGFGHGFAHGFGHGFGGGHRG